MKQALGAALSRQGSPVIRKVETALNKDVRGIPVAVLLMLAAGVAVGGVAALTTHAFDHSEPLVQSARAVGIPKY